MRHIKICGLIWSLLQVFVACSSDDIGQTDSRVPILLKTDISTAITRADVQATQLLTNQKIYVWADEVGEDPGYITNWELTWNGAALTGAAKYYPSSGNNVRLYAMHGNFTTTATFPSSAGITHQVNNNQTDASANYAVSDLLYAIQSGASNAGVRSNPATLTFYHMLSKIRVVVKLGTGFPGGTTITKVYVCTPKDQVLFKPSKTTTENMLTQSNRAAMLYSTSASSATAEATWVRIPVATTDIADVSSFNNDNNYGEGIIIPQTISSGSNIIAVELSDGGRFYYKAPSAITFNSGCKYTYKLLVTRQGIEVVVSSITAWPAHGETNHHDGSHTF